MRALNERPLPREINCTCLLAARIDLVRPCGEAAEPPDVVTGEVCRVWVRGWTWVAIYTALAGSVLHKGVPWRLYAIHAGNGLAKMLVMAMIRRHRLLRVGGPKRSTRRPGCVRHRVPKCAGPDNGPPAAFTLRLTVGLKKKDGT